MREKYRLRKLQDNLKNTTKPDETPKMQQENVIKKSKGKKKMEMQERTKRNEIKKQTKI